MSPFGFLILAIIFFGLGILAGLALAAVSIKKSRGVFVNPNDPHELIWLNDTDDWLLMEKKKMSRYFDFNFVETFGEF